MPNKHFYFALGAANGTLISYAVYQARHWLARRYRLVRRLYRWDRDWFLYFPFFVGAMGLLALTPDVLYALNLLPKESTRTGVFNHFYLHSYFEWLEDKSPGVDWILNSIGSALLFGIALGVLVFYVRLINRLRQNGSNADAE